MNFRFRVWLWNGPITNVRGELYTLNGNLVVISSQPFSSWLFIASKKTKTVDIFVIYLWRAGVGGYRDYSQEKTDQSITNISISCSPSYQWCSILIVTKRFGSCNIRLPYLSVGIRPGNVEQTFTFNKSSSWNGHL